MNRFILFLIAPFNVFCQSENLWLEKPFLYVATQKMNVLYIGVENPLTVKVPMEYLLKCIKDQISKNKLRELSSIHILVNQKHFL